MKPNITFTAIIILLTAVIVWQMSKPKEPGKVTITRDTLTVRDTVYKPKQVTVEKLKSVLDTVYVNNEPVITANADTLLLKDSSRVKVKYYFPPVNKFDIEFLLKEKIVNVITKITEMKEIEIEKPFYRDTWYWVSVLEFVIILIIGL